MGAESRVPRCQARSWRRCGPRHAASDPSGGTSGRRLRGTDASCWVSPKKRPGVAAHAVCLASRHRYWCGEGDGIHTNPAGVTMAPSAHAQRRGRWDDAKLVASKGGGGLPKACDLTVVAESSVCDPQRRGAHAAGQAGAAICQFKGVSTMFESRAEVQAANSAPCEKPTWKKRCASKAGHWWRYE